MDGEEVKLNEMTVHKLTKIFKMRKFKPPHSTEKVWRDKLGYSEESWDFEGTWGIRSFFTTPRDEITWLKVQHRNLYTASLDKESSGNCATGCGTRENQEHFVRCPWLKGGFWNYVIELIYRVGGIIPDQGDIPAYLIGGRISGDTYVQEEAGILFLAWRCLYAETVRSHVEKKALRLLTARKRLGGMLRARLQAYGSTWERWVIKVTRGCSSPSGPTPLRVPTGSGRGHKR